VAKLLRDSPLHHLDQSCNHFPGVEARHEEEVGGRVRRRVGGDFSAVDRVCCGDDAAVSGLAKDLGEPRDGDDTGLDEIAEHRSGPDGWQLVHVTGEQETG